MCGRFASQLPRELLQQAFSAVGDIPNTPPSWNVAPMQMAPVISKHPETGERWLSALEWGFVSRFTKHLRTCKRPINARSESVAKSPTFRGALASRRCIVPADAFYVWKGLRDSKQPYAISRSDRAPLALAGLWEGWCDRVGDVLRTFTILTTAANADMVPLHDRMPVILESEDWPLWLGERAGDHAALLRPARISTVRFWPVSRAVDILWNDGADLLEPVVNVAPLTPVKAAVNVSLA